MQAFFRDLFCRSQSSDRIRLKGNDLSLVWNGHSCPLPLTLILDFDSDSGLGAPFLASFARSGIPQPSISWDFDSCQESPPQARTVEERRFSGAQSGLTLSGREIRTGCRR
jgi:hypothetical protein